MVYYTMILILIIIFSQNTPVKIQPLFSIIYLTEINNNNNNNNK